MKNLEEVLKARLGEEKAGHKYVRRIKTPKGWRYIYKDYKTIKRDSKKEKKLSSEKLREMRWIAFDNVLNEIRDGSLDVKDLLVMTSDFLADNPRIVDEHYGENYRGKKKWTELSKDERLNIALGVVGDFGDAETLANYYIGLLTKKELEDWQYESEEEED